LGCSDVSELSFGATFRSNPRATYLAALRRDGNHKNVAGMIWVLHAILRVQRLCSTRGCSHIPHAFSPQAAIQGRKETEGVMA